VLSLALTALGLLFHILNLSEPSVPTFAHWGESTLMGVGASTVGAIIASQRTHNPIGWLLCASGLVFGAVMFASEYAIYALLVAPGTLPAGEALASVHSLWVLGFNLFVLMLILFPTGQLPRSRWRWVVYLYVALALGEVIAMLFLPGTLEGLDLIENPLGIESLPIERKPVQALIFAGGLVASGTLILRLRRGSWVERQQIKWLAYAAAVATGGSILAYTPPEAIGAPWVTSVGYVLVKLGVLGIPISIGIAILRYRLYEIDTLINRTLVYGALTSCVVGIYVLAVGGLGALFESRGNVGVTLMATGLVAVVFQPLRGRLQRGVNRLMYGERDDPYAVISRLGRRLEATLAPDTVLPTVVKTIAEALKLPYAAILLKEGEGFRTASSYGSPTAEPEALPLVYQREEIGRLLIGPRAPGEGFSDADRSLLEDLARQAEVAVHAVRITADLQRSRERLVTTREEERRRLRRDLHDGFGPTLASLALGLNAARRLMASKELQDADEVLARLEQETEDTVADVRRLIYGLRPPALDDLGFIAAIRQQAESQGMVSAPVDTRSDDYRENELVFQMEAPEELPPLPAAVEVAAFRVIQEALTNVARHARAKTCCVRLSVDEATDALQLEVTDDGVGMPEGRHAGVGLSSMRERAVELGGICDVKPIPTGGTRVLARLPLSAPEEYAEGAKLWTPSASS
jgi:signal transduction histidine kinase